MVASGNTVRIMPIDLSDRQVQELTCTDCGRNYKRVVIFVTQDGDAYSVISAVCHGHPDDEVWLDASFGSWQEPLADQVTFSCRISSEGAGLVDAIVAGKGDADDYGKRLTQQQALQHPSLPRISVESW